ncbi:MAG: hypothetical protein ACKOEC_22890 [Acidimicrobiia bacterium]
MKEGHDGKRYTAEEIGTLCSDEKASVGDMIELAHQFGRYRHRRITPTLIGGRKTISRFSVSGG